jgi:anti-sigma factor RsiW
MGVGRKLMWGLAGMAATKVARAGTRRAMHNPMGQPRLPMQARRRTGLGTAVMWAAGAGIVLAMADVFKEQKQIVKQRVV